MRERGLCDLSHALERIAAGGEPIPGRGCYGIRLKARDVYEDDETSERGSTIVGPSELDRRPHLGCAAEGTHPLPGVVVVLVDAEEGLQRRQLRGGRCRGCSSCGAARALAGPRQAAAPRRAR
jgi:hypothetical protein